MKFAGRRVLQLCWGCIVVMAFCVFFAILKDRIYWAGVAVSLGLYAFLGVRWLRCPHCGKGETLQHLTHALVHEYYCPHCGERIVISD